MDDHHSFFPLQHWNIMYLFNSSTPAIIVRTSWHRAKPHTLNRDSKCQRDRMTLVLVSVRSGLETASLVDPDTIEAQGITV